MQRFPFGDFALLCTVPVSVVTNRPFVNSFVYEKYEESYRESVYLTVLSELNE